MGLAIVEPAVFNSLAVSPSNHAVALFDLTFFSATSTKSQEIFCKTKTSSTRSQNPRKYSSCTKNIT